jgi:hypothetical protein
MPQIPVVPCRFGSGLRRISQSKPARDLIGAAPANPTLCRHARAATRAGPLAAAIAAPGLGRGRSSPRAAAGERLHLLPPRPADARLPRRTLRGVGRAVVLGGGEQLRDQNEQRDLTRHFRMCARPATRAEGDNEHRGEIASHRA